VNIVQQSTSNLLDAWIKAEQEGQEFPVPFGVAWEMAGYSTKASAKRALKDVDASCVSTQMLNKPSSNASGVTQFESISLSIDGLKDFCLLAKTVEGRSIRKYFIHAEKELRQLRSDREFPNKIIGSEQANSVAEYALKLKGAVGVLFAHLEPELQLGIQIEGVCKKYPELREALESQKPKLLLEAPLLSPTDLGKILEAKDSIKRSGQFINKLLIDRSLQIKTDDKKMQYKPIGQGIEFSKIVADTASGHGKTIQSLRWYESVLDLLS
jgi:hypothetical protein